MIRSEVPEHLLVYIDEAVAGGLMTELMPGIYALTDDGYKLAGKKPPTPTPYPGIGERDLTIQHRSILMRCWRARFEGEPGLPDSQISHTAANTLLRFGLVEAFTPADQYTIWWRITDRGVVVFAHLCRNIVGNLDGSTHHLLEEAARIQAEVTL